MELNQLRIFARVVEEGGFTRAAQSLHLTQPAVSQQIRALEREFGVELLQRQGRHIRTTPAGEAFLEYARGAVSMAERGASTLAEFRKQRRGRLILGAGNTTITFRLPPILSLYRRREPDVELIVKSGHSHELLELLERGDIDLALVTSPPARTTQKCIKSLFHDEIMLILPRNHPLSTAGALEPDDLRAVPSILFARASGFRRFLDEIFARAGYCPRVVMELDSIEGIKKMVQIGLGLSFLPRVAVEPELQKGDLIAARVEGLVPATRTTYAVQRIEQFPSGPLESFMNLLQMENF